MTRDDTMQYIDKDAARVVDARLREAFKEITMKIDPYSQRRPLMQKNRALEAECAELRSRLGSVAAELEWNITLICHKAMLEQAIREDEE